MAKAPLPSDSKRHAQAPVAAPAASFPLMPAIERLDAAIARLETAVDGHTRRTLEERRTLNTAMEDLRSNHAALQAEARTVSARLDAVIGRLKAVADES